MKVSVTFDIDDETRRAIAYGNDHRAYDGKRKATREEIEGAIRDGAENSLSNYIGDYFRWQERTA